DLVIEGGLRSLEICKRAGVPVAYGSDLLGQLQIDQSREFRLRREVLTPIEIIRQATLVGAEVVRQGGKLGVIAPGVCADILVAMPAGLAIGLPASLAVARRRFRGRETVNTLLLLPLVVPGVVAGAAIYVFQVEVEVVTGLPLVAALPGLVLAHVMITIPWTV